MASALIAACASDEERAEGPATDPDLAFIVIGDTPYDDEDAVMLGRAVDAAKAAATPFVIHIGDYKGGRQVCTSDHDDRFATLIGALAPIPVFYTPGDNEWTDCDRFDDPATGERYSDLARLAIIRERFLAAPPEGSDAFAHERQSVEPANARWSHEGVRFATLFATGTNNARHWVVGDVLDAAIAAADARDRANAEWIAGTFELARHEEARAVVIAMQGDPNEIEKRDLLKPCDGRASVDASLACDGFVSLRTTLYAEAATFDGPVLVIHGDTAPFTLNQAILPGSDGEAPANIWRLNAAGDAGTNAIGQSYGVRDVTRVDVRFGEAAPFAAVGLTTGSSPGGE